MDTIELQIHRVRRAIRDVSDPDGLVFRIVSGPINMNVGRA
ncbi:hypothetical protein BDD14_1617 [Edaphobacter modestus]|uniref:Uncharacterized protein n=1 Tax=Edaphobacter modestus TaxID=388466 RepID=A0A4Q7YRN9_9BACT|nr:hypothetical protein BDD14_1617 [Edaphobacter modestus]